MKAGLLSILLLLNAQNVFAHSQFGNAITCTICHIFANYVDEHRTLSKDECLKRGEKQCESMGQFSGSCYPVIEEHGPDIYEAMHNGKAPTTVCEFLKLC